MHSQCVLQYVLQGRCPPPLHLFQTSTAVAAAAAALGCRGVMCTCRPVLTLSGELDGQMRWPWMTPLAADSAVLAQKAGPL